LIGGDATPTIGLMSRTWEVHWSIGIGGSLAVDG
jgi:hypothetical protein